MTSGWLIPILNLLGMGAGRVTAAPPVAAFTGTPLTGDAPLAVQFTDQSSGSPTSWFWERSRDVGSSWQTFSNSQNPRTIFSSGTWSVRLTVENDVGSDTDTKTSYISTSVTEVNTLIKAVINFYNGLDPTVFPNSIRPYIYLDEAPKSRGTTTITQVPYVIIKDGGEEPVPLQVETWSIGESKTVWDGSFTLSAYYEDLGEAATCMKAILWNGENPALKQGLAFCTLSMTLPLVSYPFNCKPGRHIMQYAGFNINDQRIHKYQQQFVTRIYFDPQAS